jgi:hypothetical protein
MKKCINLRLSLQAQSKNVTLTMGRIALEVRSLNEILRNTVAFAIYMRNTTNRFLRWYEAMHIDVKQSKTTPVVGHPV